MYSAILENDECNLPIDLYFTNQKFPQDIFNTIAEILRRPINIRTLMLNSFNFVC